MVVAESATNDELFFGKKVIQAYVGGNAKGNITGGGVYAVEENVTLTVTPQENNGVTGWSDDADNTSAVRNITVTEDAKYTATLADLRDPICYSVLSEEDKTAYVSRFYYESVPTEGLTVDIPETVEIDGETYTVVQFGTENSDFDNFRCYSYDTPLSVTFPKTIKALGHYSLDMIHGSYDNTTFIFKSENAPSSIPNDYYNMIYCRGNLYVPYGAEEAYKSVFRPGNVQSRHTDLNIADGAIEVNGSEYIQHKADGDVSGTIDETLVIFSEDNTIATTNTLKINGGTEEQPVRVALKDVNINLQALSLATSELDTPVYLANGAWVDMLIQGTNTLCAGNSAAGIRVATSYSEDGTPTISTLNICQLSTGTLNTFGGSECGGWGGGAGIGGNVYENPGNIFINAGTIVATGCKGGAGIGGGWICTPNKYTRCGRIAINGGNVTAVYGGDGDYDPTCGVSVGDAVGSANNPLLLYISDDATFTGTLKNDVVIKDIDGNIISALATVYKGSKTGSEEVIIFTSTLEDNAIAFTDSPALADNVPNVVLRKGTYDGVEYANNTCRSLNLVDGKSFYTPEEFIAENAQFTINTDADFVYADGTNGWRTLCLPFDGDFYADDAKLTPFNSKEDTDGTFWLKTFSGNVNGDVLGFDFASSVEKGKPYIYTIPGDTWGEEHSLKGKRISVRATNVTVGMDMNNTAGAEYSFEGSLTGNNIADCYVLNADGNKFELQPTAQVKPFSAVIKAVTAPAGSPKRNLYIDSGDTTGIFDVIPQIEEKDNITYNLNGQRVSAPVKGTIYIRNGKKFIY